MFKQHKMGDGRYNGFMSIVVLAVLVLSIPFLTGCAETTEKEASASVSTEAVENTSTPEPAPAKKMRRIDLMKRIESKELTEKEIDQYLEHLGIVNENEQFRLSQIYFFAFSRQDENPTYVYALLWFDKKDGVYEVENVLTNETLVTYPGKEEVASVDELFFRNISEVTIVSEDLEGANDMYLCAFAWSPMEERYEKDKVVDIRRIMYKLEEYFPVGTPSDEIVYTKKEIGKMYLDLVPLPCIKFETPINPELEAPEETE